MHELVFQRRSKFLCVKLYSKSKILCQTIFYLDFPKVVKTSDEDSGNASKVEVFVDWSDKLNSPKKLEDSLDHAYTKLKFNRNLMSMVGRSPVKPGEIHITCRYLIMVTSGGFIYRGVCIPVGLGQQRCKGCKKLNKILLLNV